MEDVKKIDDKDLTVERNQFQIKKANDLEREYLNQVQPSNGVSEKVISHVYRPDIDGLRAVAVSIVVIFHAWPQFMPGGFIGVDVFFVISGYLISGIIIKQSVKDKFSFADFYIRRVKRIYPALTVVLVVTLALACKYFAVRPLEIVTRTMAAASVFGANIQILTYQRGYFDPQTKVNPLLHLWSLGVEEQFYIIWPLLLSLTIKFWSKRAFSFLTIFTISSFTFGVFLVYLSPKFAFYFPACRFWQMAIGGIAVYSKLTIENKWVATGLSGVGLAAILITIWFLNESSLFPGFWALIPTLGAVCIIQAGMKSYINDYLLGLKPVVWIGKISYPFYLWHWPLLVFLRYLYPVGSKYVWANTFLIVGIALVCSVITYYLIEERIRYRKSKFVWISLLIAILLIGVASLIIHNNPTAFQEKINLTAQQVYEKSMIPKQNDYYMKNGRKIPNVSKNSDRIYPTLDKIKVSKVVQATKQERWSSVILQKKIDQTSKYYKNGQNVFHFYEVANQGRQNVIFVVGDSHAEFMSHRLGKLFQQSKERGDLDKFPTIVLMATQGIFLNPCEANYNFIMNAIRQHRPKRVVFIYRYIGYWRYYKDCKHNHIGSSSLDQNLRKVDEDLQSMLATFRQIKDLGVEIHVSTLTPEGPNYIPDRMIDINGIIGENVKPIILSDFLAQNKPFIDKLQTALNGFGVNIIRFTDHLCWENRCQVTSPTGYSVFRDNDHHSKIFSANWAGTMDFLTQF